MADNSSRKLLLQVFHAALEKVNGEFVVSSFLEKMPLNDQKIILIATGKAAAAMSSGAWHKLNRNIIQSLVVTKTNHCEDLENKTGLCCIEAAHPIPDANSLKAGHALLDLLQHAPKDATILALTSGGTSALVEALPEGVSLSDLQRLNHWLLASGLDIHQVNRIRQSVSLLKAGGLLSFIPCKKILHLMLSDVPGDDPAVIGSGMWVKQDKSIVMSDLPDLPEWICLMQKRAKAMLKKTVFTTTHDIEQHIVANNQMACNAAAEKAQQSGQAVFVHPAMSGDVYECGQRLAHYLKTEAPHGVHIWGGETTVQLPVHPGRGGRNQQLALTLAQELKGNENITFLAAGTDGSDGPTIDAGAIVDGATITRGEALGLDSRVFLKAANAGVYLEETGDLLYTGVTGTNVMDLVLAQKTG